MASIGQLLKQAREKANMKQGDVAQALGVRKNTVSRWECDEIAPAAPSFLQMCELYQIRNAVSYFRHGRDYEWNLNAEGVRLIEQLGKALEASGQYSPVYDTQEVRTLPLFLMPASAGTGLFLDGDDYEDFEVDNSVPLSADFCIRIAGDSMEPRIQNGQIVFVKKQQSLEPGEIGIFSLNGEALCKVLSKTASGVSLVSINKAYEPIEICNDDELRVFGKVV